MGSVGGNMFSFHTHTHTPVVVVVVMVVVVPTEKVKELLAGIDGCNRDQKGEYCTLTSDLSS
jgi:hypothetical protein